MAFNVNELILDRVRSLTVHDLSNGEMLFRLTSLEDPSKVIARPSGFFIAPEDWEYVGDVMNVTFANGWIEDEDGKVFIYYASSDTRMHVATSTVERLVDYCLNTEPDGGRTGLTVERINRLIDKNIAK